MVKHNLLGNLLGRKDAGFEAQKEKLLKTLRKTVRTFHAKILNDRLDRDRILHVFYGIAYCQNRQRKNVRGRGGIRDRTNRPSRRHTDASLLASGRRKDRARDMDIDVSDDSPTTVEENLLSFPIAVEADSEDRVRQLLFSEWQTSSFALKLYQSQRDEVRWRAQLTERERRDVEELKRLGSVALH
ncbi:hypothetical protein CC80DRAFT_509954 [Byssothecium circinans]|uniref:Uncharacterized protein n=1 Tax=Byssothecium circinans TaxID=147558 RepID=A0A6A5TD08_9PLEO|nr:hypothetical protein CC80DRAFT_509954 [Byssothecium circinans]